MRTIVRPDPPHTPVKRRRLSSAKKISCPIARELNLSSAHYHGVPSELLVSRRNQWIIKARYIAAWYDAVLILH